MSEYNREKKDLYWQISGLEIELKKYKDIEDELGIELTTLFNIFKQKYIIKKEKAGPYLEVIYETGKYIFLEVNTTNLIINWSKKALQIFEDKYLCQEDEELLYFKDYGKTWALTKEELL